MIHKCLNDPDTHSSYDSYSDESCIFCLIANDQDEDTEILKKNDELVCFRDIFPAAPHHYLVIPRRHTVSCLSLVKEHVSLVVRMAEMGKDVLRAHGITNMKDIRMGFHRPPYTSVNHLHLHVLAPASQITDYMEHKFCPGTFRFVTDNELVCFRDSKPGAAHHYLVVPRMHVGNCKTLQQEHIPLVERMETMGRRVLERNKVTDLDNIRLGFHLPPFSSVPHLHLHVIAPASQMSSRSLIHYGPQSYWFITVDKVLHQLRTHNKVK